MDIEDLGLCQWAFAMEVEEGSPHCSILCSRTCNPEVATSLPTSHEKVAATKLISYEISLEDYRSPHITYLHGH